VRAGVARQAPRGDSGRAWASASACWTAGSSRRRGATAAAVRALVELAARGAEMLLVALELGDQLGTALGSRRGG